MLYKNICPILAYKNSPILTFNLHIQGTTFTINTTTRKSI